MRPIQIIRSRLGLSQVQLAKAIGVSQSNVCYYERGQTIPPAVAKRLVDAARALGFPLTFDHIYGADEIPRTPSPEATKC